MKLRADQLPSHLKQGLKPVYLVSGDEPLLTQEAEDQIRHACKTQGYTERQIMHVENGFNWGELIAASQELSLFADKKLIELRLNGKAGAEGSKAIIEYCENCSDDNILLISSAKLDPSASKSKWVKTIDSVGVTLPIWPIELWQLPKWLQQRLSQQNLSASQDAMQLLCDRVEGNLLAAVQELEKLKLLVDGNHIDVDDVLNSVGDNARYDVFNLVDSCMSGNTKSTIKILHNLQAEGGQPTLILWALTRELRTLYKCKEQLEQGLAFDQVMKNHRIWDKRKPLTQKALNRLSCKAIEHQLQIAGRIDAMIKGLHKGEPWNNLEQLALLFSGKRALAKSNLLPD